MEARRVETGDWLILAGYGDGGFRLGEERHEGAILIHREAVHGWSGEYSVDSLAALLAQDPPPEILLIGTGERFDPAAAVFAVELRKRGIAVDMMATPAACRTYNLLVGDGRRVAAALRPVA
ncbi:MAG: Mth938-like domain-containing protein [Geminicoccaceae bacterium]